MTTQRNRDDDLEIDIEHFLDYLGVDNIEKKGREYWFSCPFPGHKTGDSSQSASFRPADKHPWWMFNCFGCGSRGDSADFFAKHQGLGKMGGKSQAKQWIREEYGTAYSLRDEDEAIAKLNKILRSSPEQGKRKLTQIDECHQEERSVRWEDVFEASYVPEINVPEALKYLFLRGFQWQTLEEHEIGLDPVTEMLSIPYRDEQHRLLGFKGRAWWEGAKPRYMMLGNKEGKEDRFGFDTFDVSQTVYGLHDLPEGDKLIVVEGELNRMAMKQYGHRRVVGVSGQFVSEKQIRIIHTLCDQATLIFDDDEKAVRAARGNKEREIPGLEPNLFVNIVPARDADPADASDELVASWLDAAISPFEIYCDL